MTAVEYAQEMGLNYATVWRWLKEGKVPGAEQVETLKGPVWQIPRNALKLPKRGKGRPIGAKNKPKPDTPQPTLFEPEIKLTKKTTKKGAK